MVLKGVKVVEMMGLAPGPFCGTILADFGAEVTVVQKIVPSPVDVLSNGKKMLSVNLKTKEGVKIVRELSCISDVVIDTFRPGVMEKLGLGPDLLMRDNSRLIYARLTGYGQMGNFYNKSGHDINYVAMSGILSLLSKEKQPPHPPINLLADFAGGSLSCAFGILLALYERTKSGTGQIVDCSMTEGAAYLATWLFKSRNLPIWSGEPGKNMLDGGLSCYRTYKTKDGKFMAVGALEPQFYSQFLKGLQLSENEHNQLVDNSKKIQEIFSTKTQEEWCDIFENLDACVTPVLEIHNVDRHKCHTSRSFFYKDSDSTVVPGPSPKLSRTPGTSTGKNSLPQPGQHTVQILMELGYTKSEIEELISENSIYCSKKCHL